MYTAYGLQKGWHDLFFALLHQSIHIKRDIDSERQRQMTLVFDLLIYLRLAFGF
jgi:hypothetical protein